MADGKPETVDEYIESAAEKARPLLRELRGILREVAPDATETLKWGKPVFEDERILFSYAAFKSHLNFMPTRSSLEPFAEELAAYETGRDTIKLPYNRPLPRELIQDIAAYRMQEVQEGALWMHHD